MKMLVAILGLIVLAVVAVFALGTDVDIEDTGALPEVDISAEGGRMPDVDVNAPEIRVNTNTTTVKVPKVDVHMEEKTVKYPTINMNASEDSVIDEANEPDHMENE